MEEQILGHKQVDCNSLAVGVRKPAVRTEPAQCRAGSATRHILAGRARNRIHLFAEAGSTAVQSKEVVGWG